MLGLSRLLPILGIVFFAVTANGQSSFNRAGKLKATMDLSLGIRNLGFQEGVFYTAYVDESPSRDFLVTTTESSQKYNRFGLSTGLTFHSLKNNMTHSLFVDFALGQNQLFLFGYNIGWGIQVFEKASLRPSVNLALGFNRFKLGQLDNNASYIQINGNQYFNDHLDLRLVRILGYAGPQADLRYEVGRLLELVCSVAYDFGIKTDIHRIFGIPSVSGGSDNDPPNALIELDDPSLVLEYNSEPFEGFDISYNSLRLSLGLSFRIQ